MKRVRVKELFKLKEQYGEQCVTICGWVRSNRSQAQFGFLNINDGSYFDNVQVVYDQTIENFEEVQKITHCSTGCGGCHDKIMDVIADLISK